MAKLLPLSIRDIAPGESFTRITGIRSDGFSDGFHAGGAWLSPDWKEVWKPLDGRPYANADCHVETQELEVLELMDGRPGFPKNWRVEERNGRRFLVRAKAIILEPEIINWKYAQIVEQAIRDLNAHYWTVGDTISVGFDRDTLSPFIVDLSAAHQEKEPWPADENWRILDWLKWAGFGELAKLRKMAENLYDQARIDFLLNDRNSDIWPGEDWSHIYISRNRPISPIWASIPNAHYIQVDKQEMGFYTWVVTPEPLGDKVIYDYELTWAWSPIQYIQE